MRRLLIASFVVGCVLFAGCSDSGGDSAPQRKGDLRLVTWNVLHGVTCPPETADCQGADRTELFLRLIEEAQCPEIVALQEINAGWLERLTAAQTTLCDGDYELVRGDAGTDRELVLTSLEVTEKKFTMLAGNQRSALRVGLHADVGDINLVVTHIGANQNDEGEGGVICRTERQCPDPDCPEGSLMVSCQMNQLAELAEDGQDKYDLGFIVGDYNLAVTAPQVVALLDAGYLDTYIEAGNPECEPATGVGCTSGRADMDMSDLTDPNSIETSRIDHILALVPDDCEPVFDPADDPDGDGVGSGIFGGEPTLDGPNGVVFVSDHTGMALDLSCKS